MLVMNYKVVPRDIKADLTELVGIELRRHAVTVKAIQVTDCLSTDSIFCQNRTAAAWLAQLVERLSAVREVEGSSPRLNKHSLFKITEANV